MRSSTDVFVVGGGPAGLAAAIAAAQHGLSVVLADSSRPPIDKACGEGIMPDGLVALRELEVDPTDFTAAPFEGIRFVDAAGETCARFPQGVGLAMKRPVLHEALAKRAESLGVELRWGRRVESIAQGSVTVAGEVVRSRYIVCADGQNSRLRGRAGLSAGKVYRRRYGFRNHYRITPWSSFVEVHWADCGQMYVTPVSSDEICVAFITADQHTRLEEALSCFPELYKHLSGQQPCDREMGAVTVTRKLAAVVNGNVALIGDASGSPDAISGDGLSLSFQQAHALAEAMCSGKLAEYQAFHQNIGRLPRLMGELMLVMDDHRSVRRRMFRAFAQSPRIFEKLLAVHTRSILPRELGLREFVSFGWTVLTA